MLTCHICVKESVHIWLTATSNLSVPRGVSLSSPLSQLILPQDWPPSQCLPGWLLSSNASCPRWHELMIAAQALQPSLIHYVSQPGLHRFWHSLHGTEQRHSQISLFTPLSHPLAPLRCAACGGQGRRPWAKCHRYLTWGCAARFFKHRSCPDSRWLQAGFPGPNCTESKKATFLLSIKRQPFSSETTEEWFNELKTRVVLFVFPLPSGRPWILYSLLNLEAYAFSNVGAGFSSWKKTSIVPK